MPFRSAFSKIALLIILLLVFLYAYKEFRTAQSIRQPDAPPAPYKRNVYIITASGLRPSHLSSYLYQHSQTPAIDFLAYDGIRFINTFTTSTDSLSAHLSMLSGFYPFHQPLRKTVDYLLHYKGEVLGQKLSLLPLLLNQKGYRTAAFLSDPDLRLPSFFNDYFHEIAMGDRNVTPWEPSYSIAEICNRAREWIFSNRQNFHFVLLNFGEPAYPFSPPEPYHRQYQTHPYDGEIAALDEQIGLFVDLLKDLGLFRKSIIVLTSPFGESLGGSSRFGTDRFSVHIPLIIAAPGLLPRQLEYHATTGIMDLAPTILKLLQHEIPSGLDGLALFEPNTNQEIKRDSILGENRLLRIVGIQPQYFVLAGGEFFYTGSKLLENGKNEKAIQILKKERIPVLPMRSNLDADPAALSETVLNMAREGKYAWAADLLESFGDQISRSPSYYALLGSLYLNVPDAQAALKTFQQAVAMTRNPQLMPLMARAQFAAGDAQAALESMQAFLKTTPAGYYEYSMIGEILAALNKYNQSLEAFDRAIRQNRNYAEAYVQRARVHVARQDPHRAELDLKTAIKNDPRNRIAYKDVALLLIKKQQPAEAIPYLRKLLSLDPEDYQAMMQLAQLHGELGNREEAKRLYQDIILYAPNPAMKSQAKQSFAAL